MPEQVRAYLSELSQRGMAGSTVARRLSAIRQFHRFMYLEGGRPDDPTQTVDGPRRQRPLPRLLDQAEIEALIAAAGSGPGARPAPGRHTRAALCQRAARFGAGGPAAVRARRRTNVPGGQGQGRQGASGAGGSGRRQGARRLSGRADAFLRPGRGSALSVPLARPAGPPDPTARSRSCCASWRPRRGSTPHASRRMSCVMPSPVTCSPAAPICARCS